MLFLNLSVIEKQRPLRDAGNLGWTKVPIHTVCAYSSIVLSIAGSIGLILLSCFDYFHYTTVHYSSLALFMYVQWSIRKPSINADLYFFKSRTFYLRYPPHYSIYPFLHCYQVAKSHAIHHLHHQGFSCYYRSHAWHCFRLQHPPSRPGWGLFCDS